MKLIVKMFGYAALAAIIVFLIALTACDNAAGNNPVSYYNNAGPVHFEGMLKISGQQVWVQNKEAKRQSDKWYFKFTDNADINIFAFFSYDIHGDIVSAAPQKISSGKIDKGILNFEAPEPTENLVNMDVIFPYGLFKEYTDVEIKPSGTMGNIILPETSDGVYLNREGLFLMYSSIGMESIQFVYIDRDCQITGKPDIKTWDLGPKSYISRTETSIDLQLKKGWNTLYRMEVFDRESGYDNVSMGISNPNDFKWVLYK